jgi:hypothetical protein
MSVHVSVCCPDSGQVDGDNVEIQSLSTQAKAHCCVVNGVPPVHPAGKGFVAVLVC